jgi:hypothetical protein
MKQTRYGFRCFRKYSAHIFELMNEFFVKTGISSLHWHILSDFIYLLCLPNIIHTRVSARTLIDFLDDNLPIYYVHKIK